MTISRRRFLTCSVAAAALSGPFAALGARTAMAKPRDTNPGAGYGPLAPVPDHTTGLPLLWLPRGFEYLSYGWTGDMMDDG